MLASVHLLVSVNSRGGGMSEGFPLGAPSSTHAAILAMSALLSERSCLKLWMPTVLSRVHGGISRLTTLALTDRAQGRASSKVSNDIGAIDPGRWQSWQDRWRMGAMSLVKVTCVLAAAAESCAVGTADRISTPTTSPSTAIFIGRSPFKAKANAEHKAL